MNLDGTVPWPAELVQRYRAEGYWREETLGGLLREWAKRSGEATAVVDGAERLSYAALDRRADGLALALRARGIGTGARVVVQLPNCLEFAVVLFGLLRAGAVPVLALPAHRRAEIEHLAVLSGAVGYVIRDRHEGFDYRELAREVQASAPALRHVLVVGDPGGFTPLSDLADPEDSASAPDGAAALPEPDPGDVAVLLISGGTTGAPKLIPRTHRDYAYNARTSAEVCGLTERDRYLVCLPAAHNFPLACPGILGTFSAGGTAVFAPAPTPEVAFGLIERERITATALVPPLVRFWVDAAGWDGRDLASLRLLQVGGARLDAELARQVRPALGCVLQQVFGMAEGLLNYTRLDDPEDLVTTTQGRPLSPADEIRVVDAGGTDVPPGEVGELHTRGPYTLRGYYRAEEYNAGAFDPRGFFKTGDLVRQLPTGHLVVEGRVKEVINRGGENVAATELEEHLLAHPAIAEAAVLALPDPELGEQVCAVVVVGADQRPPKRKELKSYLAQRGLASFKHPDRLVVRADLPLTGVGKIDKRRLADRLAEEEGTR